MQTSIANGSDIQAPPRPKLNKHLEMEEILRSSNLATHFNDDERSAIGRWVVGGYVKDLSSRIRWAEQHAMAMKLALQVKEVKTFPWTNASNVKFPLVTIGALQFLARISILTKGENLANFQPMGVDADGKKTAKAKRVSNHINYQLVDETAGWADADEQTKFAAAILGSSFKKTIYDPVEGVNHSDFVAAQHFVVDYSCTDLQSCRRYTHVMPMDPNQLQERVTRGVFLKEPETHASSPDVVVTNLLEQAARESQGLTPGAETEEVRVLEQYTWLDLDGDGYEEPYTVSVREDTGHLYRIVARFFDDGESIFRKLDNRVRQFENLAMQADDPKQRSLLERRAQAIEKSKDNKVIRIVPMPVFTKYLFVPSPDGGFYGLGLGSLLGPVNEAVDSVLNQLVDAGTMSNTAGGWIARGARMKAGKTSFDPFEWKPIDVQGDDLRKSIVPLPVKEPSQVLFNLLQVLIEYGERISSATDIMTGVAPGQNTPATTTQTTVEQGMMLFSGIYARMYRSFREELATFYYLNRLYFRHSPRYWDLTQGPDAILAPDDYLKGGLKPRPAADPSVTSGQQRRDRANRLVQAALSPLGAMWDKAVVARKWLESEEWNVEEIFPDPTGPRAVKPPVDPKVQQAQAELQLDEKKHQDDMMLKVVEMQSQVALNRAKILELRSKAEKNLADADGADVSKKIALINAQIGAMKVHNDTLLRGADMMLKGFNARTDIEGKHHKMLMDVHDRMVQEEAADRENLAPPAAPAGQNSTSSNGGAA